MLTSLYVVSNLLTSLYVVSNFHNLSVESNIVARFILTSLSIDEMLTSLYCSFKFVDVAVCSFKFSYDGNR